MIYLLRGDEMTLSDGSSFVAGETLRFRNEAQISDFLATAKTIRWIELRPRACLFGGRMVRRRGLVRP